jgi:hypothetical protein
VLDSDFWYYVILIYCVPSCAPSFGKFNTRAAILPTWSSQHLYSADLVVRTDTILFLYFLKSILKFRFYRSLHLQHWHNLPILLFFQNVNIHNLKYRIFGVTSGLNFLFSIYMLMWKKDFKFSAPWRLTFIFRHWIQIYISSPCLLFNNRIQVISWPLNSLISFM